ncbi:MAG: hypothetical protein KGR98_10790 [Verrucomicrobia bacterium]|nr:hypothetical protein [Verrucomicrobiota bacterium]MDE3097894.1 hypothetical protein [Verrucomicrobiota bacterium]
MKTIFDNVNASRGDFFLRPVSRPWFSHQALVACCIFFTVSQVLGGTNFSAGPIFDEFPLTLGDGNRTEAAGPLYYSRKDGSENTWAIPPLYSHDADPAVEQLENDYLYPIVTYGRYGSQYRWQFIQIFSASGGADPDNSAKNRVTIFPFYFHQHSTNPEKNYTAVVPFYGHLKNRLFRDEIFFVMFPVFGETRKNGVVTDNYLYPVFDRVHGNGVHGWQVWPLFGTVRKPVTTITNDFGQAEVSAGYRRHFALWPIHFWQDNGIGTTNERKVRADIPLYVIERSPMRDSTAVLWPFFEWINDRGLKYHEWQGPWPFVVVARGPGKTATRFFPLFSRAHNNILEDNFYLWPLYKFHRVHSPPLDRRRTRILFYLFQNVADKNTATGQEQRRVDLWPLFVYHRDFHGDTRLQLIAPVESMLPDNRGVERNWSPLWSVWRSQWNAVTGANSQSLLWNLYRRDASPEGKKISAAFGLFQYRAHYEAGATNTLRLFFIPVARWHGKAGVVEP